MDADEADTMEDGDSDNLRLRATLAVACAQPADSF